MFFLYVQIFLRKSLKNFSLRHFCYTFALPKGTECSAVGSALRSGRRGRAFESPHSDKSDNRIFSVVAFVFFIFVSACMLICNCDMLLLDSMFDFLIFV